MTPSATATSIPPTATVTLTPTPIPYTSCLELADQVDNDFEKKTGMTPHDAYQATMASGQMGPWVGYRWEGVCDLHDHV